MSFPRHLVREDSAAEAAAFVERFAVKTGKTMGKSFVILHGNDFHFRSLPEKMGDDRFIFCRRKRTGGIKHLTAGTEHIGAVKDDFLLQPGKIFRSLLLPRVNDRRILPEHALAGAGRIHHDFVKIFRIAFRHDIRRLIGHKGVGNAEQLQIPQKCLCPRSVDIVSHKKSFASEPRSQSRRFAAGCGAQVQHPLPRLHRQPGSRSHGARFLQVIQPRRIKRMSGRSVLFVIKISFRNPRDFSQMKRSNSFEFLQFHF